MILSQVYSYDPWAWFSWRQRDVLLWGLALCSVTQSVKGLTTRAPKSWVFSLQPLWQVWRSVEHPFSKTFKKRHRSVRSSCEHLYPSVPLTATWLPVLTGWMGEWGNEWGLGFVFVFALISSCWSRMNNLNFIYMVRGFHCYNAHSENVNKSFRALMMEAVILPPHPSPISGSLPDNSVLEVHRFLSAKALSFLPSHDKILSRSILVKKGYSSACRREVGQQGLEAASHTASGSGTQESKDS